MVIVPIGPEMICDVCDDLPIGPASCQRLEHFIKSLDSPLSAGESAFLFQTWSCRQNDIGILASDAKKDFLHDEEFELGERVANIVCVGIDDAHLLADQIHCLELTLLNGIHHLV